MDVVCHHCVCVFVLPVDTTVITVLIYNNDPDVRQDRLNSQPISRKMGQPFAAPLLSLSGQSVPQGRQQNTGVNPRYGNRLFRMRSE